MNAFVIDPIVAALNAGDPLTAERLCRERLQQVPNSADLQVSLAVSLWHQGKHVEALEIYARLAQLHPEDSVHWRNYATALRSSGDLEASEHAYETAVRLAPDDAELLELYGLVQSDLGKHVEARDTLLRAFGKAPESPAIRIHAALACVACRDMRAEHLLRPWREWLPLDDFLQSELAEAHAQNGDVEAAAQLLEDLVHRLPNEHRVWLRLAALYERMNRLDESSAILDQIMSTRGADSIDPQEDAEIARQRARLATRRRDYTNARVLLERCGPRSERDFAHWFEIAQVCDKLGDTPAAMAAFERAHVLQVETIKTTHPHWFELDSRSPLVPVELVSESDYAKWPRLKGPDASQSPVFVVGYPRSGTTLLEQMLDAHPHLQSMDERPFFNMLVAQLENSTGFEIPRDLGILDQRDCDELRKGYLTFACSKVPRRWNTQLVDKNPMNMVHLPIIHRLFPAARFIFALRHPCDVLLSNYMQNFKAAALSTACVNLETLAKTYVDVMRVWFHDIEVFRPAIFISRYEELVTDPMRQTRLIADHLGLEDAGAMLGFDRRAREKRFIATPSYTQVIEPINTKGIGRWLRYREYFEPVLPILEPMIEHLGYSIETSSCR